MTQTHLLRTTQEKYELFLSNTHIEDKLADNEPSSAGFFTTPVNIDLEPLLFLRSTSAELSLSYLTIDSLGLAYTRTESISITLKIPVTVLGSNMISTAEEQPAVNNKKFILHFTDFTATRPDAPLEYLNRLFSGHVNPYIAYRLSLSFFDRDVFKDGLFSTASLNDPIELTIADINMLLRYVDIVAFTRQIYAMVLAGGNKKKRPAFTSSNLEPLLSLELEKTLLAESRTLKSLSERKRAEKAESFHLMDFEWFYNVSLKKNEEGEESANAKLLATKISEHITTLLQDVSGISLTPSSTEERKTLTDLQKSNLDLLTQGQTIRRILLVQRSKLEPNPPPPSLFSTEFLSLSMDETGTKSKFLFNTQFLPADGTEISFLFPKQASYCLGGSPLDTSLQIGPISSNTDTLSSREASGFSNIITSRSQRLPSAIRHHPKILRVSTNVLSGSDNKDLWPPNQDFPEFQTIYSAPVDDSTFQQRFIYKNDSELQFHRLLRSENSLQQIALLITDQCGRIVFFPRNTYIFARIRLEPISKD